MDLLCWYGCRLGTIYLDLYLLVAELDDCYHDSVWNDDDIESKYRLRIHDGADAKETLELLRIDLQYIRRFHSLPRDSLLLVR